MKYQFSPLFALISFVFFLVCSCERTTVFPICQCLEHEACHNLACYPDEWVHEIDGNTLLAKNSFIGSTDCLCTDTLVFFIDTAFEATNGRFGLIVSDNQGGFNEVTGVFEMQVSDSEYSMVTGFPICTLNDEEWYADLHFFVFPDSVVMDMKLWTVQSEPGVYGDTCNVTFYRKP
jgi:hypothetical protein